MTARSRTISQAADGTRTHAFLHGNRLDNPHKRLVLRFSAESDYRRLRAIRSLLVPQWSPAAMTTARRGVAGLWPLVESDCWLRRPMRLGESVLVRVTHCLRSVTRPGLHEDAVDVCLNGRGRDDERSADLGVVQSARDQRQPL